MPRKRENKIYRSVPFRSYTTTHNGKFQKNSKKIQKIKKNTIMASFRAKLDLKKMRNGENKNYRSVSFLPNA